MSKLELAETYLERHRPDAVVALAIIQCHLDVSEWTVAMDQAVEEITNYRDALKTASILGIARFLMDNLEVDEERLRGSDGT